MPDWNPSRLLRVAGKGLRDVIFPRVCLACGGGLPGSDRLLCMFCADHRFEDPNPERQASIPGVMLPASIEAADAMWRFDRTGGLREILHNLKYGGLTQLGHELGILLWYRVMKTSVWAERWQQNTLLLPVPMHASRRRNRGYNQTEEIVSGIQRVSGMEVIPEYAVKRIRATMSQTGFSQRERLQNMSGVFKIEDSGFIRDRNIVIIDDVLTTGATMFELAGTLNASGAKAVWILAIAVA